MDNEQSYDFIFKIVLLGDSGVGKPISSFASPRNQPAIFTVLGKMSMGDNSARKIEDP